MARALLDQTERSVAFHTVRPDFDELVGPESRYLHTPASVEVSAQAIRGAQTDTFGRYGAGKPPAVGLEVVGGASDELPAARGHDGGLPGAPQEQREDAKRPHLTQAYGEARSCAM